MYEKQSTENVFIYNMPESFSYSDTTSDVFFRTCRRCVSINLLIQQSKEYVNTKRLCHDTNRHI